MKKAVKYIVVVILIIISYQYGKGWERASTERRAFDYINNDCTEAEQIALEIVIFGEVQN